MSQENVELARRVLDAISRRDASALIELSDPQVEWHSLFADFAAGGMYRGHDGAARYIRDLDDAWEVGRAEVEDGLGLADIALLVGRIHYRGKGSGVESDSAVGWMLKFRHRKLVSFQAFRDPAQVLETLGRRE